MKMINEAVSIHDISLSTMFEDDDDFASKTNNMGSNCSMEEDKASVMACHCVRTDLTTRTDQSIKPYWKHIVDHCHCNVFVSIERSIKPLDG